MKEQLKARIKELEEKIDELNKEKAEARQKLAEMSTEFKVGDRVTYEGANNVWELTAIKPGYGNEPNYFGRKIKKDGTPGALELRVYGWYRKTLVKVN